MAKNLDFELTTAARLAHTWTVDDRGSLVADLDTGDIWMVTMGGSGVGTMARVATSGTDVLDSVGIKLGDWREVSSGGDVGDIAANGGILASDTTPILRGDAAESWEISWATGNVDPISCHLDLPIGFDGTQACYLDLEVYSGTTDAATFTVETSWDGGALVSDSAADTSTKSATRHVITATIAAADVPNTARSVTIALTPTDAHATNAYQLCSAKLRFYRL